MTTEAPTVRSGEDAGSWAANRRWALFTLVGMIAATFTAFLLPLDSITWLTANTVIATVALLVALLAAKRMPKGPRGVWYAFAGFQFFLLAGDIIYNTQSYLFGEPYGFSIADVFYFASYGAGFVAVGILLWRSGPDVERDAWVDSLIVMLAGIALVSTFVVSRALTLAGNDASLLDVAVAASYPLQDVFIFAALVRVISGRGRMSTSLSLAAVAMAVYGVADLLYNATIVELDWSDADRVMNFLFSVTVVLLTAAVLAPDASRVLEPGQRDGTFRLSRRVAWLTTAILLVPVLLLFEVYFHPTSLGNRILAVITVMVIVLVLWRARGLLRTVEWQAEQIARLARVDALTGLPNRRTLEHELARVDDGGKSAAVAMLDLDHFKEYNDTHGHQQADTLLAEVAAAWKLVFTSPHVVARYGGEEFTAVILEETPTRVRDLLEQARAATPDGVTVSIGYALIRDGETAREALSRADEAMYRAKSAGRNRVVDFEDSPTPDPLEDPAI